MDNLRAKNAFIVKAVFVSSVLLPTGQHGFNLTPVNPSHSVRVFLI